MAKGQGISINVIVIAAIALLVLVILSTLVIRSSGQMNQATTCEATGGTCVRDGQYEPSEDLNGDGTPDGVCGPQMTRDPTKACQGSTRDAQIYCCRRV